MNGLIAALVVSLLAFASPVFAQVPTPAVPISVDLLVIPATGDPLLVAAIATRNTPIGVALNCNFLALPPGPTPLINPTIGEFDDPFTAGNKCRGLLPVNLPNGSGYRVVAIYKHAGGVADSARSLVAVPPFDIAGTLVPHVAPTGVAVRP